MSPHSDPVHLLLLSIAVATLFGTRRRGARGLGTLLAAAAAAGVSALAGAAPSWIGLAAALGALAGWIAPAQGRSAAAEEAWVGGVASARQGDYRGGSLGGGAASGSWS